MSAFAEDEVERPAAASVGAGAAQVREQFGGFAPGVFERVGENGEAVEGAVDLDGFGEADDGV